MAFYKFNAALPLGQILREGLDDLRNARYKLAHILGNLQQMTAAQAVDLLGFVDNSTATSAMAELESDIGKLLNRDTGTNAAQLDDALVQMFSQFG